MSLWQQLLWVAAHREELPAVPDCEVLEPEGDIVELLRTHGPRQPPHFLERLHRRRQDVLELWREHPALVPWLRFAERWTLP